ncbi:MAG: nickel pincer cofactor biosynthesis protein LarC [Myxococcota bacterium]
MSRRLLHLDAFSGAAGNMFMGAMLDLGLSRARLLEGLAPLGLDFKLVVRRVARHGLAGRHVDVVVPETRPRASGVGRSKTSSSRRERSSGATRRVAAADRAHPPDLAHVDLAHADPDHPVGAHPGHGRTGPQRPGHAHPPGRHYAEIRRLIERARLGRSVKERTLAIFEALGRAEAKVHGIRLDAVHFHEVGAVDAIVDVTAAALALELLAIDRISCSPVALGHGRIHSAHGHLPLPAPAALELLTGIPTVPAHVGWETVTPTGAAILRTVVDSFGPQPAMTIERVGYGAGNDRPGPMPNLLRAVLGKEAGWRGDRVVAIETNLDDFVPEHFDYLMERLLEAGALDVSIQHVQMKKNRPGFLLRVLARPSDRERLARIVFAESTAIGVRIAELDRLVLERESVRLSTKFGPVRVKVVRGVEGGLELSPEYDDCKRAARRRGVALREVVEGVLAQARRELRA